MTRATLLIRFGIVGLIGFIVNYGALTFVSPYMHNHVVSEIIAALVALQITFVLHDKWTYVGSEGYSLTLVKRYLSYLASSSFGSIVTIVCYSLIYYKLGSLPSLSLAALAGAAWNFVINKIVIWRHHSTSERVNESEIPS